MSRSRIVALAFFFAVALASCSKTTNPPTTTSGTPTAGSEQIIANIGGTDMTFHASARTSIITGFDSTSIFGFDTTGGKIYKITITSLNIKDTGTYDINWLGAQTSLPTVWVQYSYTDANGNNMVVYDSEVAPNSKVGNIHFTSFGPFVVQGTFTATIPISIGGTGTSPNIIMSNGSFKILFA